MQMLSQENKKQKIKFKLKKSHICLFGSLLVIIGIFALLYNHIILLKDEVFSDIQLSLSSNDNEFQVIDDMPILKEVTKKEVNNEVIQESKEKVYKPIDYSKYTGVLEIPTIGLKRGFYNVDNKYNNIKYNVTVINGSDMPDVTNGNLILAAHSGDAYISYFAYLYKLNIGDEAYITYDGITYKYQIVNIYNVPKTGAVTINRNYYKTTLTLITCTKDDLTQQTVYIAELV